jgi:type I restriction enzyme S subunit
MVFAHARHVFMADQSPFETPHLTGETLRRFRFPRPPLTEQREISAHLNAVDVTFDASCTAIRGSLHLLRERRSALISAAVTGQIDVRELGQSAA